MVRGGHKDHHKLKMSLLQVKSMSAIVGKGKSPLSLTILEVRTFITEDLIVILAAVFSFDSVFLSSGIPQLAPNRRVQVTSLTNSGGVLWG